MQQRANKCLTCPEESLWHGAVKSNRYDRALRCNNVDWEYQLTRDFQLAKQRVDVWNVGGRANDAGVMPSIASQLLVGNKDLTSPALF